MFEHIKLQRLDDFFLDLGERANKGIYFYRINGYNPQIGEFIQKYYTTARSFGVVIEGKIANPDEKNLAYYEEIMGNEFRMSNDFFISRLQKWLPRMNDYQRTAVAGAIYDTLNTLKQSGKNENMLKNAYVKFMCWLYYKFERIVSQLGNNKIPKILYEGDISKYELLLLQVLAKTGCDIVLLQYTGDDNYRKLDPTSTVSCCLELPDMKPYPNGFSLQFLRTQMQNALNTERLYGRKPEHVNCTNAWISGQGLEDVKRLVPERGSDPKLFYNCFYRINGVEEKLTYLNELYQFQLEIKNQNRNILIIDRELAPPSTEEIAAIRRQNYTKKEDMIMDLSSNINYAANQELQRLMVKSFVDVILEESGKAENNLNKLTNKAVILLCWVKRYYHELFRNWKMPGISCFIFLGGCKKENETMFFKFLSRLPVDVLLLKPDLQETCCLQDKFLYEITYPESLAVKKFPQENTDIHVGTAAYHAERELDTLMYQDSGMYRNQQYGKAVAVTLQTMYEEIAILWNQELKYRPNFSTVNEMVNIPVIFAKVSGVKEGNLTQYWKDIKLLMTPETYMIKEVPFLNATMENPIKPYVAEFYKNGKVQKTRIKEHASYQYGVLREEVQNHILEKLQQLIDSKLIKGTFENGTEYTIVSTVLNMKKEVIRMIQKFDFTKVNPKIIYMNTTESAISLEDTILMAFLNLIGFDIVFFVPTGYQTIEKYFNRKVVEEHQIGEYMYDLQIPNLNNISTSTRPSWRERIFKRGV